MIHLLLTTVDDVLDTADHLLGSMDGAGAASLVSAADRAAADSRRADRDRRRTLAGRLALRLLTCAVQGRSWSDTASIPIDRTCEHCRAPHGRPRLEGYSASTSTSGRLVSVAVADDTVRVGVDVEEHPETLWDEFDDYVLHPAERAAIPPGRDGLSRRVQVWTDKEALLKSVGVGLRSDPSGFRVAAAAPAGVTSAASLVEWRPVAQSDDPRLEAAWAATIDAGRRAAGSIAAAHPTSIRSWRLNAHGLESE